MRPYNLENDVLFRLRKTLNLKKKNEKLSYTNQILIKKK